MPSARRLIPLKSPAAPTKKRAKAPIDPREKTFNQAFGKRLVEAREGRKGRKLTQEELASALGIGYHQYKKYEYGTRSFPLYLLRDLQTITDRSLYWFLTGRE